jgi:hypothetical protein
MNGWMDGWMDGLNDRLTGGASEGTSTYRSHKDCVSNKQSVLLGLTVFAFFVDQIREANIHIEHHACNT